MAYQVTISDEYETILECSEDLRTAVQRNLIPLSGHLLKKHLITTEHDSELRNRHISEPERAANLVELVRHKVKLDRENYYTFVSILEADLDSGYYNEILTLLKSKLLQKQTARGASLSESDSGIQKLPNDLLPSDFLGDLHPRGVHPVILRRILTLSRNDDPTFVCPCCKCSFDHYITKDCPMAGSGVYPYLDWSRLSANDTEDLVHKLSSQTQDILKHFGNLRTCTRTSLIERNIRPEIVADSALSVKYFDTNNLEVLNTASKVSVAQVFMVLSRFMSFFNYEILEHIIQHLGTDNDRRNLARYLEQFNDFCRRSVFQVPSGVLGFGPGANEVKVSVHITDVAQYSDDPSNVSLPSIKRIQWKLASILGKRVSTLHIYAIEYGSIVVHFTVSSSVAAGLFDLTRDQWSELQSCGLQMTLLDSDQKKDSDVQQDSTVKSFYRSITSIHKVISEHMHVQTGDNLLAPSQISLLKKHFDSVEPPSWSLDKCSYLGSCDVTLDNTSEESCTDYLAERFWSQTGTGRRSLLAGGDMELVADLEKFDMLDSKAGGRLQSFTYQEVSHINTHQKHPNLIAFMLKSYPKTQGRMQCHAFKCDSKEAANRIALTVTVYEKVKAFRELKDEDTSVAKTLHIQMMEVIEKFGTDIIPAAAADF